MVWIFALLCMGLAGLAGSRRGPVCAAFSLLGLWAGLLLAGPLSPLAGRLLPVLGLQHPLWQLFMPGVIVFILVLSIFKIAGNAVYQKMTLHYKYKEDDPLFFRWERLCSRLGFCLGVLNGAIYFLILMVPVYVAGYFTTEAAGAGGAGQRLLTQFRSELHECGLDRVVAAYDPIAPPIYQAADLIELVLSNPLLESRLAYYPPLMALGQQKEIQDIASDAALKDMIRKKAKLSDILNEPKVQAIVTNTAVLDRVRSLLGDNLADLQEFLTTGKSPKYDGEKILGRWNVDLRASWDGDRKGHPEMTRNQIAALRTDWVPQIAGLALMATPDDQFLLRRQGAASAPPTPVGQGTWKKTDTGYEVTLPGNKPATVPVTIAEDGTLQFLRDGHILIFNKEM
jgi:hypothetical protein